MIKYIFIITAILVQSLSAQSHIKKGMINIGGSLSYMNIETIDPDNNREIFLVNPQFGYFIFDNLSLNISIDYLHESFLNFRTTEYGIGPSLRFYFDLVKINPFLSIGYSFTNKIYSHVETKKFPGQQLSISGGVDYFITDNVAIETIISYRAVTVKELPLTIASYPFFYSYDTTRHFDTFLIGLGVNIFL